MDDFRDDFEEGDDGLPRRADHYIYSSTFNSHLRPTQYTGPIYKLLEKVKYQQVYSVSKANLQIDRFIRFKI